MIYAQGFSKAAATSNASAVSDIAHKKLVISAKRKYIAFIFFREIATFSYTILSFDIFFLTKKLKKKNREITTFTATSDAPAVSDIAHKKLVIAARRKYIAFLTDISFEQ